MDTLVPQRIALVGPLPPPFGGMANQTLQLARLLESEGIKVDLVRTNTPYSPEWVNKIKGIRALFRLVPYLFNLWATIRRVQLIHLMANSGWSWHLFSMPVIWIAHFQKVPVIVNYRGGEAAEFFGKAIRWVRPSMLRANKVVVPSGFLEKIFSDYKIESTVVPNIIDLTRFSRTEDRPLNKFSPHFIVCRNLECIYDVATSIRAFSKILGQIPEARLTIAGEGPERTVLEQLTKDLGAEPQTTFAGRLDPDEMASLYSSADIMLNTSRVDNMPNALLEAMSAGVPIVSTDAGGIPYMVENGETALLRSIGDWQGIAESALNLIDDDSLYQKISNKSLSDVYRYRWDSVKSLWMHIYSEAIGSRVTATEKVSRTK